jgi:isopropylmalate/homocitrate/citramalate synthase
MDQGREGNYMTAPKTAFSRSPFNHEPWLEDGSNIRLPLHVVDVTLREGQQAPGIAFSTLGESKVGAALSSAGISIMQAGYAAKDEATVARLRDVMPYTDLAVLTVGWSPEITRTRLRDSVNAGATICSVLMRSSRQHLKNLGLSEDDAVRRVAEVTSFAREAGFGKIIVSPSFSTLADVELLDRLFDAGIGEGASVVSISDSTGIAKPAAIRLLVSRARQRLAPEIGIKVHTHNDYGLALANALAGIEAGADWIDASVLGLGERAGNCALEELVLVLHGLYGIDTGIDLTQMTSLCATVAEEAGCVIPPLKPVVGAGVFANKLEIHVRAISTDSSLLEPYDPTAVGNHRSLRLGVGTGPTGIRMKLDELGLTADAQRIDSLVEQINTLAALNGREISDEEFREIARTDRVATSSEG